MEGPATIFVTVASASHGRPWEMGVQYVQAVNRTHSEMVKYRRHDDVYDRVLAALDSFSMAACAMTRSHRLSLEEGKTHNLSFLDSLLLNVLQCRYVS